MPATPSRRRRDLPVVLYAHPFELALGVAFTLIGLRALVEGTTTPSVDQLPELPLLLYRVASTIGGIGLIVGLLARAHALGRTIERASLYAVSGTWAGYSVLVVAVQGWRDGFSTAAITLAIAAACLLRALAIRKTERVILAQLRHANANPDLLRRMVDGRPPREGDA